MDERKIKVDTSGPIWFIGWLFTIAFADLAFGSALLAIVAWPWYLGQAVQAFMGG
jgi:hypothetical protein